MSNFKVVTDSCANLPDEIIERFNLDILPFTFTVNGEVFSGYDQATRKGANLKKFYEMMRERVSLSTSCVNNFTANEFFRKILLTGVDIIYIGFSSALSVSYSNIETELKNLQKEFPNQKIICIDSLAASLGEGSLVYDACVLKEQGKTIDEIASYVENAKKKLIHLFTVDDLYYLHKGGRLSSGSYFIAKAMRIKPTLRVNDEGGLVGIGKTIGRKRTIHGLVERVKNTIVNPEDQILYIVHGDCEEEANELKNLLLANIKVKDVVMNYIDIVIGTHAGPGAIAVIYYGDSREVK